MEMTPAGPLPIKTQPGSRSGAAPVEGAGSEGVSAVGNLMLWAGKNLPWNRSFTSGSEESSCSPATLASQVGKNGRVPAFGGVSGTAA